MPSAMEPVVAKVCPKKTEQPGPGAVPGEGVDAESLVHPNVGGHLCPSHQQAVSVFADKTMPASLAATSI